MIINVLFGLLIIIGAFAITKPLVDLIIPQSEIDKVNELGEWAKEQLKQRGQELEEELVMSNIREYTIAVVEQKIAVDMDKAVSVNIDATGKTKNTIISFNGFDGDYLEVLEPYDQVVKEWSNIE